MISPVLIAGSSIYDCLRKSGWDAELRDRGMGVLSRVVVKQSDLFKSSPSLLRFAYSSSAPDSNAHIISSESSPSPMSARSVIQ